MTSNFEDSLQKYADIIVKIGLNIKTGQRLIITAPVQSASLVQKIAASAYQSGCRYVDVNYLDEQVKLARFQHAPRSFRRIPGVSANGIIQHTNGGAYLRITGEDPTAWRSGSCFGRSG
jgi:aminopeptidase